MRKWANISQNLVFVRSSKTPAFLPAFSEIGIKALVIAQQNKDKNQGKNLA